ncbi:hypothetical protein GLOIN_2v1649442 [Rhizophagus irregularis DAOM 181602=DAOM 197198]|nr:hypothetical protein GLOIN_2v1649442 [Rhizophagus irregularis DAOM 181602=DAOM 197198]
MQQFSLECLNAVQYRAFWENTKNPTLLKFLNFRLSAGDLEDKKTEYNRYNNELNTISKHYAEMSEMGQEIAKWKGAFKNDKRTKSVIQFWEVQDVARMAEEKSRAEVRMLQAAQHVTIATVTTEQVQQYARSTTTKISEKFLDEKEKLPNDGSEDDGVHVDSGEFPNSSLLALETIIDAENPLFISGHDSNDATVNQDELVPLKNTHKRLFSEIGDDLPSSHIMSVMEKYRAKSTTSKYDLVHSFILDLTPCSRIEKEFEPEFWAELIADRPPAVNATYYEEIGSICDHLFGPLGEKLRSKKLHESRDKWVKIRDLKAPEYNEGFSYNEEDWKKILYWVERAIGTFLDAFESEYNPIQQNDCGEREWFGEYVIPIFQGALKLDSFCRVPWGEITVVATDLLCKIDQQEVVCGLACGGPHKYDLTKWASDEYQLPRMLKDTLDDILEKFRGASRDSSNLYTIGIQLYMTEIRIYMMEKRDIYRLHLLKSFKLPLLYSSYDKLRLALSWAWNIRGLVKELSLKLDDSTIVSSRGPPNEMKTIKTPEKSKKKK